LIWGQVALAVEHMLNGFRALLQENGSSGHCKGHC
jgi:succinate dehydrogenase/fumarate reductase cytochrome b subunit